MILEKDSSVLGYPGETSKALNADHHNVCKYHSPKDPNYITVRNALRSLVSKIILTSQSDKPSLSNRRDSQDLKSLLAIRQLPDADYIFFRDQWAQGTNEWLLEEKTYIEWLQVQDSTPSLLWLNGGAATGKSVLASYIINSVVEQGMSCQYFFIRFGDHKTRTLSLLLRSMAYQVARSLPDFSSKVLRLADEAIDFETADPRTIWERLFRSILFNMEQVQPLYWIIDGLDEADDPRALIRLFYDLPLSRISIRVLLVGRRTSETMAVFQKAPKVLHTSLITTEGHLEDLRQYIHQELTMSGSAELKEDTVQRIVDGAQNNFLVSMKLRAPHQIVLICQWVRFAVHNLNLCHTQNDVELALQRIPKGMEALYDRMASSIAENISATDRALASTILQYVACSLRLLSVTELSQALHEKGPRMLDFQRSIVDLCGGFVVIDNGGTVAMIHQTAREYLLSSENRPFWVNRYAAHTQLFLSCMQCLMTTGLRAKVRTNEKPDFLDYASSSWSSHLKSTPLDCEPVVEALNKFLAGAWVLTWIQIAVTRQQMRLLITASKDLSRYCAKYKDRRTARIEEDLHIMKQHRVESWAEDFVKICGKFGMILRRNPESIYRLIPPFCPKNSAVYQQFGMTKDKNLVVSGLSTGNWDDSLARISFGFGNYASSVAAAGSQIAVLVSSGNVFLYDSAIFEETTASPINHGERLYRMELNSTGTLIVTYGYRTTKIWETSTGKCKTSVDNIESRPRPLAMLLTNDSSVLIVGTDDRRVRSLNLHDASPTWQLVAELEEPELEGHFLNSSNFMALNKDGGLIAVAYRGHPLSAWEIDGPMHIGHCWRKRDEIARGEVIEAVWHPHYPEVLGLYIEGVVFKWRPYDDEVDEIATESSRLAISTDGNLFATGDVRGTVKVYTTSEFCLLYKLVSEDSVLSIVFSPDLHRFYDIRGYYGNAWEPNALMGFAEQRGKEVGSESETGSLALSSTVSESWSGRIDFITVLASSPLGRLYCCGTEQGAVHLRDTSQGKSFNIHVSKSFLSIEQMCWSNHGRYLCFSDSSKKVFIKSITPGLGDSDPHVEPKFEIAMKNSIKGPILSLIFHPDTSQLLVRSSSTVCTISLTNFSVITSLDLNTESCKWITHPQDNARIIGVGVDDIHILDWDLVIRETYKFKIPRHPSLADKTESLPGRSSIDRVLVTPDKNHVLVQMSPPILNSKEKTFLYFETSSLSKTSSQLPANYFESDPTSVTPTILSQNLSSQIALALCFLAHDKLIFLSRSHEICSCRLSSASHSSVFPSRPSLRSSDKAIEDTNKIVGNKIEPLFPLPGDWISRDNLALCSIWPIERSFLCPRNGEVAVVRCATLV